MKRIISFLLVLLSLTMVSFAYSVPDDTLVYITPNGEKYHREDCTYTSSSAKSLTISVAERKGYEPCSRCNPDWLTGIYIPPESERASSEKSSGSSSATTPGSVSEMRHPKIDFYDTFGWILAVASIAATLFFFFGIPVLNHRKARREYEQKRAELISQYGSKTRTEIARRKGMPANHVIGYGNLPCVSGPDNWGDIYTVFTAPYGSLCHSRPNCHPAATTPTHWLHASNRHPCPRCHPQAPDLSWHREYLNVLNTLTRYNIEPLAETPPSLCGTMILRTHEKAVSDTSHRSP